MKRAVRSLTRILRAKGVLGGGKRQVMARKIKLVKGKKRIGAVSAKKAKLSKAVEMFIGKRKGSARGSLKRSVPSVRGSVITSWGKRKKKKKRLIGWKS